MRGNLNPACGVLDSKSVLADCEERADATTRASVARRQWLILRAGESVYLARDGDAGLAEDVCDLRFTQARGVILECELILLFVDAEAAQAISVGEFAQPAKLFEAQRGLQFIGDFEECHEGKYMVKECKS